MVGSSAANGGQRQQRGDSGGNGVRHFLLCVRNHLPLLQVASASLSHINFIRYS
jgi:hypothetical protein